MNFHQAKTLFTLINQGHPVGCDAEGNVSHAPTALSASLDLLGVRPYLPRTCSTKSGEYYLETAPAVAFLREWADALENQPKIT